ALGLSLPPPRTHVNPVQRFSDYVGGILALPAEKTFSAAMLLGNVADAAWWVPINAMMRDEALRDATGQGSGLSAGLPSPVVPNVGPNTPDVRAKLLKALGDPMHAGQVLDALNHQYGFMRNAD